MKFVKQFLVKYLKDPEFESPGEEFEYRKMQLSMMIICGAIVVSGMWLFLSVPAAIGALAAALGQAVYPFYRYCKTFNHR